MRKIIINSDDSTRADIVRALVEAVGGSLEDQSNNRDNKNATAPL